CALSCDAPAVINEFLDIARVESQRTPARAHLDGRQVRFSLAGRMLHYPGNADPQFLCHVPSLDQLPYRPNIDGDGRQEILIDSIHMLHTSLRHTDRSPCLYLWEKARFCQTIPLNSLQQDVRRYLQ